MLKGDTLRLDDHALQALARGLAIGSILLVLAACSDSATDPTDTPNELVGQWAMVAEDGEELPIFDEEYVGCEYWFTFLGFHFKDTGEVTRFQQEEVKCEEGEDYTLDVVEDGFWTVSGDSLKLLMDANDPPENPEEEWNEAYVYDLEGDGLTLYDPFGFAYFEQSSFSIPEDTRW